MSVNENKTIRVVAYVDTADRSPKNDLQQQKTFFTDFVAGRDDCELIDVYTDTDKARTDGKRVEFDRMLADAAGDKFDYIAVKQFSEVSRDINKFTLVIKRLKELGVGIFFITENVDTLHSKEISMLLRLVA
ncbi:MAG: recombinase family protein [Clostridiales bacterium]|nr:recombinase family protein [Clostridiales bacterium]